MCKIDHKSSLRYVYFLPDRNTVITGYINPTKDRNRVILTTTIFFLRLYDFNMHKVLKQSLYHAID